MCGIAGVVAWDDRFRVSRRTLAAMSARIAHRGPDGEGLWLGHEGEAGPDRPAAALAHRRLAILDPAARSDQPFTDGRRWLVFNGEIFNFRELRQEIDVLRPGYAWKTTGDTEVLLRAYDAWGEACVDRLNGMFAFAVWDPQEKSLFLARDRMGQKPLYVALAHETMQASALIDPDGRPSLETKPGGELAGGEDRGAQSHRTDAPVLAAAFASELPALLPVEWVDRSTNMDAVVDYLRWGYVPHPWTIYRGVWQAGAAQTILITHERTTRRNYFDPARGDSEPTRAPASAAAETTRSLLTRAVGRQLVSDVPLGCFLSGGIDSSIVAAGMKAAAGDGQPVLTFSIGFDDERYDETRYAAAVAEHLQTEHRSFVVRPDAAEDLPKLAAVFGQPFGDSSALPTHYLARETRRHVKVALSGDGGDELFGGYDRYRALRLATRLRTLTTPLPWAAMSPLLQLVRGSHPKSAAARARRFAASVALSPGRRYASYMRLFDERLLRRILKPLSRTNARLSDGPDAIESDFTALRQTRGLVESALAVDRGTYLPEDLLAKVDRCSMLHALEVRSPFMDHDLVRFAAGLSERQLIGGGPKRMLREAFAADLPAWVFARRKMGFAVPVGEWLRTTLAPMLNDLLFAADSFAAAHFHKPALEALVRDHHERREDHSQRLYALLMLELWWQTTRM